MTRDQLELACRREGLTRPQVAAILQAADAYATEQAKLAIGAVGPASRPIRQAVSRAYGTVHYGTAGHAVCRKTNANPVVTLSKLHVTCGSCQKNPAFKEAS